MNCPHIARNTSMCEVKQTDRWCHIQSVRHILGWCCSAPCTWEGNSGWMGVNAGCRERGRDWHCDTATVINGGRDGEGERETIRRWRAWYTEPESWKTKGRKFCLHVNSWGLDERVTDVSRPMEQQFARCCYTAAGCETLLMDIRVPIEAPDEQLPHVHQLLPPLRSAFNCYTASTYCD